MQGSMLTLLINQEKWECYQFRVLDQEIFYPGIIKSKIYQAQNVLATNSKDFCQKRVVQTVKCPVSISDELLDFVIDKIGQIVILFQTTIDSILAILFNHINLPSLCKVNL